MILSFLSNVMQNNVRNVKLNVKRNRFEQFIKFVNYFVCDHVKLKKKKLF